MKRVGWFGVALFACGVTSGCGAPELNVEETVNEVIGKSPGLIANASIGDTWDKVKTNAPPSMKVFETHEGGRDFYTLRHFAKDKSSDNGHQVLFTINNGVVTAIESRVMGERDNIMRVLNASRLVEAAYIMRIGSPRCAKPKDGFASCAFDVKRDGKSYVLSTWGYQRTDSKVPYASMTVKLEPAP